MTAPEGMYGVALKPKLLRSLLREYVPDEKHPFSNPSELSYIVSTVKTHKLLSEWSPQPMEQESVEAWKSTVDSWVKRLLTLTSSTLPDKCWAGICLLGLTCQECSSERFIASYAEWLDKLLSHVQPSVVSHFVKAASCAALSDMFTRLSGFSNAKKDATSHAMKVIQPALKLLNEDSSALVLEEAVCLLCTMINFFPSTVHRHYDSVETAIVSKIVSGKCSAGVLKKLGYGLSSLPKSRGDEDSWCLMMDKILLYINSQLNDALQGLEEEAKNTQTLRALLPSGKEPPPPLSGLVESERASDLSTRRPERLLGSRISTLMQCCCDMLTSSYPVMVSVPVCGLIALAGRVLMVDGSSSLSSYSFLTTLKQEFVCSEIPILQLRSLEILTAVVKALSSQLLPHVAGIVQLLNEYFRRCKFPDLKIKAYSIVKVLLMSMGTGIAIHISQDIISNVFIDLDIIGGEKDGKNSGTHSEVPTKLLTESRQKKRKHSIIARSSQEEPAHNSLEVGTLHKSTPISVKIAALEALESLLTSAGAMRSESWRGNVDNLLITVATNAFKGGWSKEERKKFLSDDSTPIWQDFQLAALRALLASLLSPGRVRPSHLALGLQLFRRGMQEAGTKLGEYCGHALLALEVLIHPRALPLLDLASIGSNEFKDVIHTVYQDGGPRGNGPAEPESEDDDLNENWLGKDDDRELEIKDSKRQREIADYNNTETPSLDELTPVKVSAASTSRVPERIERMVESPHFGNAEVEKVDSFVIDDVAMVENSKTAVKSDVISEEIAELGSTSDTKNVFDRMLERVNVSYGSEDETIPDIVDGDPDDDSHSDNEG
ncbi:hypothetical protein ACP275_06G090100 [Erythranthe tilingii]